MFLSLQGDLNGHRGLVPSNFLQALPEDAPAELHPSAAPPPPPPPAPEPKKESQVAQHDLIHDSLVLTKHLKKCFFFSLSFISGDSFLMHVAALICSDSVTFPPPPACFLHGLLQKQKRSVHFEK